MLGCLGLAQPTQIQVIPALSLWVRQEAQQLNSKTSFPTVTSFANACTVYQQPESGVFVLLSFRVIGSQLVSVSCKPMGSASRVYEFASLAVISSL